MNSHSEIYLVKPTEEFEDKIMDFRAEFINNNEVAYGTQQLHNADSFDAWLVKIKSNEKRETVEVGRPPHMSLCRYVMWIEDCINCYHEEKWCGIRK